jgi:hypothetical protein
VGGQKSQKIGPAGVVEAGDGRTAPSFQGLQQGLEFVGVLEEVEAHGGKNLL